MKTSTATVSIAGDLGEKLAAIAKAGFDGIEIFEQDFISFDLNPADVRKMVADHGLEITLFQPFRDFEGLPEGPLRQRAFSRARHKFDLMCELGTDLMLICSSVHTEGLGGIDRWALQVPFTSTRVGREKSRPSKSGNQVDMWSWMRLTL